MGRSLAVLFHLKSIWPLWQSPTLTDGSSEADRNQIYARQLGSSLSEESDFRIVFGIQNEMLLRGAARVDLGSRTAPGALGSSRMALGRYSSGTCSTRAGGAPQVRGARSTDAHHWCPRLPVRIGPVLQLSNQPMNATEAQPGEQSK